MSKNFKFSESFQKIHNNSEQIIVLHVNRLDRISNDIKATEQVLLGACIPFKFYYKFRLEIDLFDNNAQWNYSLEWDKKRLIYRKCKGLGFVCSQPDFKTPLIETKSQIRLSLENELPIFYKTIIEELGKNPTEDFIYAISPNFTKVTIDIPF